MRTYRNISAALLLLSFSNLFANEDILSQNKKEILKYSYEKSKEDSNKLSKDWINPITYKYIYNDSEKLDIKTSKSFISISQPIFKSGGIYSAIKYSSSMDRYSKTSIDAQKKELIKQAVNLLYEIHKIDITIKKQELLIQNAKIDVERKKELVLNGIMDTSFLDNAILDSNTKQNNLIDLQYQKEQLINSFYNISDKNYNDLKLPVFKIVDDKEYLNNNLYIKQAEQEIDNAYWLKNMTISSYLPTVNFTADYTKYHDNDGNPAYDRDWQSNVGFNITIPLDIRFSNSIQSSKLEYLKKKISLKDKKTEELNIYKNSTAKIKSLDKKIEIANNDLELYDSLVTQIKEQLSVGMKTPSDLEMIENSKKIKSLEVKSLNIDKQLQLLEIYSRTYNG
ncbi:MAG: TolC family protein [Campylobacterota bacterium]|nr:TolC family protein [Campylobacterota bacterium]